MDRSRVLCRPGFSICKRHAGLSQKSAKFLVSMENILGKIRSCWMLLKKSQHGDSILAKGMTTHPSTFLPLPLQPAAPHAWSSQLKDGDTETGKGDPLGAISLPCTSPSDVIWDLSKARREDARESLPRSSPNPGPLWDSACPPGSTGLIWKSEERGW